MDIYIMNDQKGQKKIPTMGKFSLIKGFPENRIYCIKNNYNTTENRHKCEENFKKPQPHWAMAAKNTI